MQFLAFYKMAIRLFLVMAFFAAVVLWPINSHYRNWSPFVDNPDGDDDDEKLAFLRTNMSPFEASNTFAYGKKEVHKDLSFLWAYVFFTYFFVALTIYSINWETFRVIRLRQDYLGSQSTVTDRTFRLTGIPKRLRSEAKLTALIEKLGIGTVTTVTLCRDWEGLDGLMENREVMLNKLEQSWARYLKSQHAAGKPVGRNELRGGSSEVNGSSQTVDEEQPEAQENWNLLSSDGNQPHVFEGERPQVTLRYGFLGLRSRQTDAIDYYEEKLRRLDDNIAEARGETYKPTDMALVTMDSVASCQMFIQARIDPRPGTLLTKPTPAPSDLIWKNTYAPRGIRRLKSWAITLFITVLTLVFIFPTAFLATWVSICTIERVLPSLAEWLSNHSIMRALFQNGVPTLVISLLNVAVPYLYDFLSNHQGMISRGDIELSLVCKNFFFIFFNTFFVFAVSKTGFEFWSVLQDLLKDTRKIPDVIARQVEDLSKFYISFIMLQGIGLMSFRILEVGSVFLYPISRWLSTTPRDFARLRQPPVFQYGFFLPTAILVFNLCLIYSVLRYGFLVLVVGIIYFILGYFTFKYMLLYAVDQPQHATGGAWRMICRRIVIGLIVFEIVMVGQIASLSAWFQSVVVMPLVPFTIWYSYYFTRRFEPLTKYIALRNIRLTESGDDEAVLDRENEEGESEEEQTLSVQPPSSSTPTVRRSSTLDELREQGLTFVNPSLTMP